MTRHAKLLLDNFEVIARSPDGIKKLRSMILDLAVRGRLVPQNPKDEPASKLLERIAAEKTRLIKEGKIKKEKPLPPIDESEIPYSAPKGWEWCRISHILESVQYGYTASAKHSRGEVGFLRITDIQNGKVNWKTVPGCEIKSHEYERYKLDKGDILIARTGGTIGKSYLIEEIERKAVFASYLIRLAPVLKNVMPSFISSAYLDSRLYWEQLEDKSQGTGQPNVNGTSLANLIFPLAPLEEQKRIVEKVDQLMALCDEVDTRLKEEEEKRGALRASSLFHLAEAKAGTEFRKTWSLLHTNLPTAIHTPKDVSALRKTILQLAVQGKLVPQNPKDEPASKLLERIAAEKAGLIKEGKIKKEKPLPPIDESEIPYSAPKGWEWVRLQQITNNLGQKVPDKKFTYIDVGSIDQVRGCISHDLQVLTPSDAPSRARKIVSTGCVIYSTVRPYLLNIAVIEEAISPGPIVSTAFAVLQCRGGLSNKYLYFYLRSPVFISYVSDCMKGVAYPAINDTQFHSGLIPLPPLEEQKRIVEKVDQLMALCDELEKNLAARTEKAAHFADSLSFHLKAAN